MLPKQLGILLTGLGGVAVVASMFFINHSDNSKWFPVLLVGGGALVWWGVSKYRAA